MKSYSKETIKAVVGQMLNMFDNNVLSDNGHECFTSWCEDGGVFEEFEDEGDCIDLMMELAPMVDNITNYLVGLEQNNRYHRIIDGTCFGKVMLKNEGYDDCGDCVCFVYDGDNYDNFICDLHCSIEDDEEVIKEQLEEKLY